MKQTILVLMMVKGFIINPRIKTSNVVVEGRWMRLQLQNENHFNGWLSSGTE